jgi:membrane fusion protein, multidrug efflux system
MPKMRCTSSLAYERKTKCPQFSTLCLVCLILASMAGCTKSTRAAKPQPMDVEVVEVGQKDVPIYSQWIGTLDGFVNANVKAQVTGYLLRQD